MAVVLYYGGEVKMPNTFTNEEYGEMFFVCGSCNGNLGLILCNNDRLSHIAGLHTAEHFKQYTEFGGRLFPLREQMQHLDNSGLATALRVPKQNF